MRRTKILLKQIKRTQKVFICNDEGHRQIQFKANEHCRECSSIFSCTSFVFFALLPGPSMHAVLNSGGIQNVENSKLTFLHTFFEGKEQI